MWVYNPTNKTKGAIYMVKAKYEKQGKELVFRGYVGGITKAPHEVTIVPAKVKRVGGITLMRKEVE